MKTRTTLLTAILLGTSGIAAADVTIAIPGTINVLLANDDKPEISGGLFSSSKTLTLPDGENQILFTYKQYFERGDERVILESDPIIGTFNVSNTELEFILPEYRNEKEGKKAIRDLEWDLTTANGTVIDIKKDKLVKDGMQIGRNYRIELADYNRRLGTAAVVTDDILPASINGEPIKVGDNTAEEMLHFWYSKADAETQARFKTFINKQ